MTAPHPAPGSITLSLPGWAVALRTASRDGIGTLAVFGLAGFLFMGLSWRGAAALAPVPLQVPWLVSGSLTGLALVGLALAGWSVQTGRRAERGEQSELERLLDGLTQLAAPAERRR